MLFGQTEKPGTYPAIIMLPDFLFTKKGYLAKDRDGKVYFYTEPPELHEFSNNYSEWLPKDWDDYIFIKEGGVNADILDESIYYPVNMTITPLYCETLPISFP